VEEEQAGKFSPAAFFGAPSEEREIEAIRKRVGADGEEIVYMRTREFECAQGPELTSGGLERKREGREGVRGAAAWR